MFALKFGCDTDSNVEHTFVRRGVVDFPICMFLPFSSRSCSRSGGGMAGGSSVSGRKQGSLVESCPAAGRVGHGGGGAERGPTAKARSKGEGVGIGSFSPFLFLYLAWGVFGKFEVRLQFF